MRICRIFRNPQLTTTNVAITYAFRYSISDLAPLQFLPFIFEQCGSFYKNPAEFAHIFQDLYGTQVSINCETIGVIALVTFRMIVPEKRYIGEDVLVQALSYLQQIALDISESRYDDSFLEEEKEEVIKFAKERENMPASIARFSSFSQIQPKAVISVPQYGRISQLRKVHLPEIKTIHKKMLKGQVFVFAEGPKSASRLKKLVKTYFKPKNKVLNNKFHPFISDKVVIGERSKPCAPQSSIAMVYNFVRKFSPRAYQLYEMMLRNHLFEEIREDKGLCYFVDATIFNTHQVNQIRLHVNNETIDEVISAIKVVMENFQVLPEELDSIKLKFINMLDGLEENFFDKANFIVRSTITHTESDATLVKQEIAKINIATINEIARSMNLISIYTVKGGDMGIDEA